MAFEGTQEEVALDDTGPPSIDVSIQNREEVFNVLRKYGAHILQAGTDRTDCVLDVAPQASACVVAVEVSAATNAHGLVQQLTSRQLSQLTMVLLLRYSEPDNLPPHSTLAAATKAFNQLKADGVFWEPRSSEGLEYVVQMWFACAAERAKEREQEHLEEVHRQQALKREADLFWNEVHTIFNNIPQVSLRIGEPEVGGRIGRHHDIIKLLGSGLYADVYLLRNIPSKELKALKAVAKEKLSAYNQVQAISKEISNLKRLSHPNIVSFLGAAHTPKHVCLLLEFAGSKSLLKIQKEAGGEGLLQPQRAQQLFRQVASAIAHCHSRGLAHRDLKQENIVISTDGHTAKVVDLGAADDLNVPLEVHGVVPFVAPEVLANETNEYNAASADVWSLGVILLEMLCGVGFLPGLMQWSLPIEPSAELAHELRELLANWSGLAQSIINKQPLSPGSISLLQHMLCPAGSQRWSALAIAGYASYGES